jgi:hypothetical protein
VHKGGEPEWLPSWKIMMPKRKVVFFEGAIDALNRIHAIRSFATYGGVPILTIPMKHMGLYCTSRYTFSWEFSSGVWWACIRKQIRRNGVKWRPVKLWKIPNDGWWNMYKTFCMMFDKAGEMLLEDDHE